MTPKAAVAFAMSVAVHGVALVAIGSAMRGTADEPALPRRESVPVRVWLIPAYALTASEAGRLADEVREIAPHAKRSPGRSARRMVERSVAPRAAPPPGVAIAAASTPREVVAESLAAQPGIPDTIAQASPGEATQARGATALAAVEPAYLNAPEPAYPAAAREEGQEGLVILRVRVSAGGLPLEVALRRSSGSRVLDRAAMDAVRRWTFVAARRGTQPIESWVDVPIRFRLEG